MCEFLKSHDNGDMKRIAELSDALNAEKLACDALFHVLTNSYESHETAHNASDLYSRILLARETHDYAEIERIAQQVLGQ